MVARGRRIVFGSDALEPGNVDIYDIRTDGSGLRRLTDDPAYDAGPDFTHDGNWILFDSDREGQGEIYVMAQNGGSEHRLTNDARSDMLAAASPGGTTMAFSREGSEGGPLDIWVASLDGGFADLTNSPDADDMAPDWQPLPRRGD